MSAQVSVANFVPEIRGLQGGMKWHEHVSPEAACDFIRQTFEAKADSLEKWSELIRDHARIPPGHPFERSLEMHGVSKQDFLWTLGSLAFASETQWIEILEVVWPDGTRTRPNDEEKHWLVELGLAANRKGQ